ncbi:hypothetical protein M5D96_014132 [Drosophila gunungcola]|uniref:Uncharacterized protein n=1 Tax=Drosophila gunungcola TaxID=103775 RepID=A0A9Q0BIQ4_9MUSC|nr:hypothetical protein M5D96_014132 [Drosophila gunungcola]
MIRFLHWSCRSSTIYLESWMPFAQEDFH